MPWGNSMSALKAHIVALVLLPAFRAQLDIIVLNQQPSQFNVQSAFTRIKWSRLRATIASPVTIVIPPRAFCPLDAT